MNNELTQARLKELLVYSPETGLFTRRVRTARFAEGSVVGRLDGKGYPQIYIDRRCHSAHRLVFLYVYGRWPSANVDHINRVRTDNRLSNLRECTYAENNWNRGVSQRNTSGTSGVYFDSESSRWRARLRTGGKSFHLGYFEDIESAKLARQQAELKHFGEFASTATA